MSQNTNVPTTTSTGSGSTIARIFETLSSAWIQREMIRDGQPLGYYSTTNSPDQYATTTTGADYDGSTLVEGQWVSGVSNTSVLAGVAGLAALGIVVYAVTR